MRTMAHLALTIDSDAPRRSQFITTGRQRLENSSSLTVESFELGDLAILWACGERTPCSISTRADQFHLLLGYAIDDAGHWLDAIRLRAKHRAEDKPNVIGDGYFAAVSYDLRSGLALVVDPVGMFPCYWSIQSGQLIAATSAELIGAHPLIELEIDRSGLAGILLTNGNLNHQSLFAHIHRLRPGHRLISTHNELAVEQQVYSLQRDDSLNQLDFDQACQVVGHELRQAINRHTPKHAETTLMLSGGMDSRLMAGYLQRSAATRSAICFGLGHDYESRAAIAVGQTLDLPVYLDCYESTDAQLCEQALEMARWDHLAGGFGCIHGWTNNNQDYVKPDYFWSGYLLDDLIGGVALATGLDPSTDNWSFDYFQGRVNRWGLPPETISQLLQSPQSMLDSLTDAWRAEYECPQRLPHHRAFAAKLASRARFHIGAHLHRLAFQSWPLLPMLDRRLLHVLFNLHPQWLLKRRLETELLQRDFPRLAAIPFDTNSFRFVPKYVSKGRNAPTSSVRIQRWLHKNASRWYWTQWKKLEPRRYHRLYDLNSPQWRPIRSLAESERSHLHQLMDGPTFDSLLPRPHTKIRNRDPFAEGAPRRTLLGLMLWHARKPAIRQSVACSVAVA